MSEKSLKRPRKIAFYGLFGQQNWGNECTLQAIIHNVRIRFPDAELKCFCTGPADTSQRHNIPAYPISNRYAKGYIVEPTKPRHLMIRLIRKVFIGMPMELVSWLTACKSLRGFDMLLVPGTGLLTDFSSSPFGLPYRLFKWALIAKLCRCMLLFVSVGAGPIYHPLTKWLLRAALSLAEYRSYRDNYSKSFVESIGFKTDNDRLYPDLAFSLPRELFPECKHRHSRRTIVGVGVKDYYGVLGLPQRGGQVKYRAFINNLSALVSWLLENGYSVRLLIGDPLYDNKVKQDLMDSLPKTLRLHGNQQIINEPILSVDELVSQIAATDMVISARFHNILLAIMMEKPVISLSYHPKFASLMDGVGLGRYCHDIDDLNIDDLTSDIVDLQRRFETLEPAMSLTVERYRHALDEQYARIVNWDLEEVSRAAAAVRDADRDFLQAEYHERGQHNA